MNAKELFTRKLSYGLIAVVGLTTVGGVPALNAQTLKVIHEFNGTKGGNPVAQLVADASGNLYGTAETGGQVKCSSNCGVVFKLYKTTSGGWAETVLHSFRGGKFDGGTPEAGVVLDGAGNIYGTTFSGGGTGCGGAGCGAVYRLSPGTTGGWTYTLLYAFTGAADGSEPLSQLLLDPSGNLYGTTLYGGGLGYGTVFELSPTAGGWSESVLYSFTGGSDGANPYAGVVFDSLGNLYGTTWKGANTAGICAPQGCGVVFELSKSAGVWTETVLHAFGGTLDGGYSQANLILDAHGNLYGVTPVGGTSGTGCGGEGCGVVFELSNSSGVWTETVLLNFLAGTRGFGGYGGASSYSGLAMDASGNIYGATHNGGTDGIGVAFELSPPSSAGWTEKVLHSFTGPDGDRPLSGVTVDGSGHVFGATQYGGTGGTCVGGNSCGVIYEITP